jgi:hypothetical protein
MIMIKPNNALKDRGDLNPMRFRKAFKLLFSVESNTFVLPRMSV